MNHPNFTCRIPTVQEIQQKWDYEISTKTSGKENWVIWKEDNLENFQKGDCIPYYGFLDKEIICEATVMLNPEKVQNHEGLIDSFTAYLCAFRTIEKYQGKGYFSSLFGYMIADLKKRGFTRVTIGVEPSEQRNKQIYHHYGFTHFIKKAQETYPDGTCIDVEYYEMHL